MIGGSLELTHLGIIYPGGTVPVCVFSVALVAIPIALRTGLDAHAVTVLVVPFGVLGSMLWSAKYSINSTSIIRAQKSAENGNYTAVTRNASVYPLILTFFLAVIPIFLANTSAPTLVEGVINSTPTWAMHGIEVASGVLPTIGLAAAVYTIGKMEFLPFFVIGYFLVIYFEAATTGAVIFGTCTALLYLLLKNKKEREV